MVNPVVHFEISGSDGGALGAYYEKLFGWKPQPIEGMPYWMVEKPEEGIGGGIATSQDGSSFLTFYVRVDDVQKALDQAVALGGEVRMPKTDIPGMVTIAIFADPQGNAVGLVGAEAPPA